MTYTHTVILEKLTWHIRNIEAHEMPYLGKSGWTKRPFARRFATQDEAQQMRETICQHDPSKIGKLTVEIH